MIITISLDNLDEALRQVTELQEKVREFPHEVAQESADNIRYDKASTYMISTDGEHKVRVRGDQLAFQEYGAGFTADYDMIGNIPTYPGVYSEDHKETFQKHLAQGKAPGTYRYNRTAQRKMRNEVERLRRNTESKAQGYFR